MHYTDYFLLPHLHPCFPIFTPHTALPFCLPPAPAWRLALPTPHMQAYALQATCLTTYMAPASCDKRCTDPCSCSGFSNFDPAGDARTATAGAAAQPSGLHRVLRRGGLRLRQQQREVLPSRTPAAAAVRWAGARHPAMHAHSCQGRLGHLNGTRCVALHIVVLTCIHHLPDEAGILWR